MTDGRPLEGKVAAITGASSGIGAATAVALAGAGASVTIGARRREKLEDVAKEIASDGGLVDVQEVDVAEEDGARAFVQSAKERFGQLDILVNNAGVMLLGPVDGADTEHWRRMVDVNVLGLLYCTHAAIPLLRDAGGGHIVNVSSVAGRIASLGSAVYNLTKWGVGGFSEGLRQEVLHSGIRVTVIEPGFVETELQGHNEHPIVVKEIEKMREKVRNPLQPEDIARAIVFAVTQPEHVAVNEVLVRPVRQAR